MLSHVTQTIIAAALALSAHASIPGWQSAAVAAPTAQKKCTAKGHRHAQVKVVKTSAARGSGVVQVRRSPDVHMLSYGP